MNNPAPIGHNRTPFEEISDDIKDLFDEAKGWLDGEPIQTQGQADSVEKLLAMIKASEKKADGLRKEEVKPLDQQKKDIQGKYNPLIGKTTTVTGLTKLAIEACQEALTPWKQKLQAERDAEAEKLRLIAEQKQIEAKKAMEAAALEDRQKAEDLADEARRSAAAAKRASKDTIKGMRTEWSLSVTDSTALLKHYWSKRKYDLEQFAKQLAEQEMRAGKRTIPGCEISSRKVAK